MADDRDQSPNPPKSPHSSDAMTAASSDLDESARLALAHELALNENMEMTMPAPDTLYGHVKEIVHRYVP